MQFFLNNSNEVGIDEAGRGPLLGRVYAGAVVWSDTPRCDLIKDSKKLSPKKRKLALEWIKKNIKDWSYGYATEEEIDQINILEATKLAIERAINNLKKKPSNAIIDGVGWEKMKDRYKLDVISVVKGDSKYYSIAAASIIAKEYHDDYIRNLCQQDLTLDQKYDLLKNKGYGTKKHIEGIQKHGISDYHRKTFKQCKEKDKKETILY